MKIRARLKIIVLEILVLAALLLFIWAVWGYIESGFASPKKTESHYQKAWCLERNGEVEHINEDGTRTDCLTDVYAIEFDFARKWYQAIGQSLHYSLQTGKKAGVVLIIEKSADLKYWGRLKNVIDEFSLPIAAWKIKL
jgi:hypothetical protein